METGYLWGGGWGSRVPRGEERLMKGVWGKDRIAGRGKGTGEKFEVGYLYGVD